MAQMLPRCTDKAQNEALRQLTGGWQRQVNPALALNTDPDGRACWSIPPCPTPTPKAAGTHPGCWWASPARCGACRAPLGTAGSRTPAPHRPRIGWVPGYLGRPSDNHEPPLDPFPQFEAPLPASPGLCQPVPPNLYPQDSLGTQPLSIPADRGIPHGIGKPSAHANSHTGM